MPSIKVFPDVPKDKPKGKSPKGITAINKFSKRELIGVILEGEGLTSRFLAQHHMELLNAEDEHGNPLWEVRQKQLKMIHELRGDFVERKETKTMSVDLTDGILADLEK